VKLIETALPGCVVIEPVVHGDARGLFYESFNARAYAEAGIEAEFVQSNV
jgi:dTDP-4-dehydrorhamnose 3,5-epimerase